MIEHHQMAIKMGQDAVKQASHDELRKLAGRMVDTQKKEIEEMRALMKTHRH